MAGNVIEMCHALSICSINVGCIWQITSRKLLIKSLNYSAGTIYIFPQNVEKCLESVKKGFHSFVYFITLLRFGLALELVPHFPNFILLGMLVYLTNRNT